LRELQGDAYRVPTDRDLKVQVRDGQENLIFAGAVRSNSFGSASGHLDLSAGAAPGQYEISLATGGHTYEHDFHRRGLPQARVEVTVTPARDRFVLGDDFSALLSASTSTACPSRTPASPTASRGPRSGPAPAEYDSDLHEDEPDYGEQVAEGEGHTDAQGHLSVSLPTSREKDDETPDGRATTAISSPPT